MVKTSELGLESLELAKDGEMSGRTFLEIFAGFGENNLKKIDDRALLIKNQIKKIQLSPNTILINAIKETDGVYVASVPEIEHSEKLITNNMYIVKLSDTINTTVVTVRINGTISVVLKKINLNGELSSFEEGDILKNEEILFRFNGEYLILVDSNSLTFSGKQINSFVLKDEVINDLISSYENAPLSANMGKKVYDDLINFESYIDAKYSNVDNTSDIDKPVSVAQSASIKFVQDNLDEHSSDIEKHASNIEKDLWNDKYTKVEIDNKLSSIESNIDWKESVESFDDIANTYENPVDGWTVNVKDTDYTYRYNGVEWVSISANSIPKATNIVDGLMSKESVIDVNSNTLSRHNHGNKNIIDSITSSLVNTWNTISEKLSMHGGILTGFLTLHANPTSNLHASTKQYVDAEIIKSGDMKKSVYDSNNNGKVNVSENAEKLGGLAPSAYATAAQGAKADAALPLSGGTVTGNMGVNGGRLDVRKTVGGVAHCMTMMIQNDGTQQYGGTGGAQMVTRNLAGAVTLHGNAVTATSATKATQDASGNVIASTYGAYLAASGNNLQLKAKNGAVLTTITPSYAGSANYATNAHQANGGTLMYGSAKIRSPAGQQLYFAASSEASQEIFLGVLESGWRFCPIVNGQISLGGSVRRWNELFLVNAPNVSSDRRLKKDIATLDSRYTQLLLRLPACRYKLIADNTSGYRCGFIAQDVEALLSELDILPEEFTALVKSPIFNDVQVIEVEIEQDSDGDITETEIIADRQLIVPEEYTYSLRYEEFISPLLALVQIQDKRITALEQRLSALETN